MNLPESKESFFIEDGCIKGEVIMLTNQGGMFFYMLLKHYLEDSEGRHNARKMLLAQTTKLNEGEELEKLKVAVDIGEILCNSLRKQLEELDRYVKRN